MFAKFSPDGTRVAYVRANNLYVEELDDGAITRLTTDGSRHDHQRHVRLGLRGGARPARRLPLEPGRPRASPSGSSTRRGVGDLPADQRHRLALPGRHADPVPEGRHDQLRRADRRRRRRRRRRRAGCRRPAIRASTYLRAHGVGRATRRVVHAAAEPPAEPERRAGSPTRAPARCAACFATSRQRVGRRRRTTCAWLRRRRGVPLGRASATAGGTSTRVAARRRARRAAHAVRRPTSSSVDGVDEAGGWLYFIASPDERDAALPLSRARSTARAPPSGVTPADQPGTHAYTVSPERRAWRSTPTRASTCRR